MRIVSRDAAADHFAATTRVVRGALAAADRVHGAVGTRAMRGALDRARRLSGGRLPKWTPAMPRPVRFRPQAPAAAATGADAVVYFPSCAARNMGAARGRDGRDPLPEVAQRLFAKAGFRTIIPAALDGLCCGQPFESKGLFDAADRKAGELEAVLRETSDNGRLPIVFDTSPCAYRMRRFLGERLRVQDCIEFVHDTVLPRVTLIHTIASVALHPVCSVRKMGLAEKLERIAVRCGARVTVPESVQCCGFAGDRGFMHPELNEHALRHLRAALPGDCAHRVLDEPHLRDRPGRRCGDPVRVDPLPGRCMRAARCAWRLTRKRNKARCRHGESRGIARSSQAPLRRQWAGTVTDPVAMRRFGTFRPWRRTRCRCALCNGSTTPCVVMRRHLIEVNWSPCPGA